MSQGIDQGPVVGARRAVLPIGAFCHGSQANGIVWYGKVVGYVQWDSGGGNMLQCYAIQYYYDRRGDPPRKSYRIEEIDRVHNYLSPWLPEDNKFSLMTLLS